MEIQGPQGGTYYLIGREANNNAIYYNNGKFVSFENGVKTELKAEPKITKVEDKYNWIEVERQKYADKPQGFQGAGKLHSNNEYFKSEVEWKAGNNGSGLMYKVYQQEIDLDLRPKITDGDMRTNFELMQNGRAPFVIKNGQYEQIQLHHSRQDGRGSLFELTEVVHKMNNQNGGKALHPNSSQYQHSKFPVERVLFDKDRSQYWKDRVKQLTKE